MPEVKLETLVAEDAQASGAWLPPFVREPIEPLNIIMNYL